MSWWLVQDNESQESWYLRCASQQERLMQIDISLTAIGMHRPTRYQKRKKALDEEVL